MMSMMMMMMMMMMRMIMMKTFSTHDEQNTGGAGEMCALTHGPSRVETCPSRVALRRPTC
eukprot:11765645-Karenia_brevis.AAC.1